MPIPATAETETHHGVNGLLRWCKGPYWLAALPSLPILLLRFFYPDFLDNEAGKLIEARRILEPGFLSHDWLQAGSSEDVLYRAFSLLIAPLWLLLKDAILVAMVGRLLVWGLLLYSLLRFARAMGIARYSIAIGLAVWLFRFQTLGANEWIFGGIEGKCVAYALLFLALESALRKRTVAAALFCGLAIWMHVLVGGWGTMALGVSLLLCRREYGWRRSLQFCAVAAAFLAPLAFEYLREAGRVTRAGSSEEANRMIVLFISSLHVDPLYFHGRTEFLVLCTLAAITVYALDRLAGRGKAALIGWFLAILLLQFGAGLAARGVGAFWYLKLYPFRAADTLVALLFWLAAPMLVVWISTRGVLSRWPVRLRVLAWGAVLLLPATIMGAKAVPVVRLHLAIFENAWAKTLHHRRSGWDDATRWLRLRTPSSAVVLAPPWEKAFWLEAERAEVVNLKRVPHDRAILEWYERMVAVNGGPFHSRSEGLVEELQRNYPRLDAARVRALAGKYGADYFMATGPTAGLADRLVYQNGEYFIYRLQP